MAQDFTFTEWLGIVFHEIQEYHITIPKDGKPEVTSEKFTLLQKNESFYQSIRGEWERGDHGGDCTSDCCSCMACFWWSLLEDGTELAIAIKRHGEDTLEAVKTLLLKEEYVVESDGEKYLDDFAKLVVDGLRWIKVQLNAYDHIPKDNDRFWMVTMRYRRTNGSPLIQTELVKGGVEDHYKRTSAGLEHDDYHLDCAILNTHEISRESYLKHKGEKYFE